MSKKNTECRRVWGRCENHPDRLTKNPGGRWCQYCITCRYRERHPESVALTKRIYYLKNADAINAKERARYAKFPYTRRDAAKAYYERVRSSLVAKETYVECDSVPEE